MQKPADGKKGSPWRLFPWKNATMNLIWNLSYFMVSALVCGWVHNLCPFTFAKLLLRIFLHELPLAAEQNPGTYRTRHATFHSTWWSQTKPKENVYLNFDLSDVYFQYTLLVQMKKTRKVYICKRKKYQTYRIAEDLVSRGLWRRHVAPQFSGLGWPRLKCVCHLTG